MAVEQGSGSGGGKPEEEEINKYYVPLGPGTTSASQVKKSTSSSSNWTWRPQQRYTAPTRSTTKAVAKAPTPPPEPVHRRVPEQDIVWRDGSGTQTNAQSSLYQAQIDAAEAARTPHGSVWRTAETADPSPWYTPSSPDTAKRSQSLIPDRNFVAEGWNAATRFLVGDRSKDTSFSQPTGGPDPWDAAESFNIAANSQQVIGATARAARITAESEPEKKERLVPYTQSGMVATSDYRLAGAIAQTLWPAAIKALYSGGDMDGAAANLDDIDRLMEIRDTDNQSRQDEYIQRISQPGAEGAPVYGNIPGTIGKSVFDYVTSARDRSALGLGKNVVGTYLGQMAENIDAASGLLIRSDDTGVSESIVRATNSLVNRATDALQYSIQTASLTEFRDSGLSIPGWLSVGVDAYGDINEEILGIRSGNILRSGDSLGEFAKDATVKDVADLVKEKVYDRAEAHRSAWNPTVEDGITAAWEATQAAGVAGTREEFEVEYRKAMGADGIESLLSDSDLLAKASITAGAEAAVATFEEAIAAPITAAAFGHSAQTKIDQAAMMEPGPEKDALLAEAHHEGAIANQASDSSPWQIYLDNASTAKAMFIETVADPNMLLEFVAESVYSGIRMGKMARATMASNDAIREGANPAVFREALSQANKLVDADLSDVEKAQEAAIKAQSRTADAARAQPVVDSGLIDVRIESKIESIRMAREAGVSEGVIVRMEDDIIKLRAQQEILEQTTEYKIWKASDYDSRVKTKAMQTLTEVTDYTKSRVAHPTRFWRVTESGKADIATEHAYDLAVRLYSGVDKPQDAQRITLMYLENPKSLLSPLENMADPALNGRVMGLGIDLDAYEPVRLAILETGTELTDVLSRYSIKTANGGGKFNPAIMPSLFGDATMKGDTIASGIIENPDLPIGVSKVEWNKTGKTIDFLDSNGEVLHAIKGKESDLARHQKAAEHMRLNREKNYVRVFNNKVKHWLTTTALITRPGTWINNALNANFYSMVDRTFTVASEKTVDEWWRMMTGELDYSYRLQGDGIDGFREAIGMEARENGLLADTLNAVGLKRPAESVRKARSAVTDAVPGPESAVGAMAEAYSGQSRWVGTDIPFGEAANYANQLYGRTKSLVEKWIDNTGSEDFKRWLTGVMGDGADPKVIDNMVKVYKSGARKGVNGMTEEMAAYLRTGTRQALPEDFPDDVAAFMNYVSPDGFRRVLATGDIDRVRDYAIESIRKYEVMAASGPMEHGSGATVGDIMADLVADVIGEAKMVASGSGADIVSAGAEAGEAAKLLSQAAARISDIRAGGEAGLGLAVQGAKELDSLVDTFRRTREVIAETINPTTPEEFVEYGIQARAAADSLKRSVDDLADSLSRRAVKGTTTAPEDTILASAAITNDQVGAILKGASVEEERIIRSYHDQQVAAWAKWKPGKVKGEGKDAAWDGYKAEMREVTNSMNLERDALAARLADGDETLRTAEFTYAQGESPPGNILAGLMTQPYGPNDASYRRTIEQYKGYTGWHRNKMVQVAEAHPGPHVVQIYVNTQADVRRVETVVNGRIEMLQQQYRSGAIEFDEFAARRNEVYLDAADAKATLYADAKEEIITADAYAEMKSIQDAQQFSTSGDRVVALDGSELPSDLESIYFEQLRQDSEKIADIRQAAHEEIKAMRILHESPAFAGTTDRSNVRRMAADMLGIDTANGDAAMLARIRHDKYDNISEEFVAWFDQALTSGGTGLDNMEPAMVADVSAWVQRHGWDELRNRRQNRPDISQLERRVREADRALLNAEGELTAAQREAAQARSWSDIKLEDVESILRLDELDNRIIRERAEVLHARYHEEFWSRQPDPAVRDDAIARLEELGEAPKAEKTPPPTRTAEELQPPALGRPTRNIEDYMRPSEARSEGFRAEVDDEWNNFVNDAEYSFSDDDPSEWIDQQFDNEARRIIGEARFKFQPRDEGVDAALSAAEKLTPRAPREPIMDSDGLEVAVSEYLDGVVDDPIEWLNDFIENNSGRNTEIAERYFSGTLTPEDINGEGVLGGVDSWVRDEVGRLRAEAETAEAAEARAAAQFDIDEYDRLAAEFDPGEYRTLESFEDEARAELEQRRRQGVHSMAEERAQQLGGARADRLLAQLNNPTDWEALDEAHSVMPQAGGKAYANANEIVHYADAYLGMAPDQIMPYIQDVLPDKPKFRNRMLVHEYSETDRRKIYRKLQERAVATWEARMAEAAEVTAVEAKWLQTARESAEADAIVAVTEARNAAVKADELLKAERARPHFTAPQRTQTIDQAAYDFVGGNISAENLRSQIDEISPAMPDVHAIDEARKGVPDLPNVASIEDLTETERRAMSTSLSRLTKVQDEVAEVRRHYDGIMEAAERAQRSTPPHTYGKHVEADNFRGRPSTERAAAQRAKASMAGAVDPSMQDFASYAARMSDDIRSYAQLAMMGQREVPVDPIRAGQIMNWATHEGTDKMKAALLKATELGKKSAAFTMLDYSKRRYIDEAMGMFAPYTYFMTRNAWNSLRRSAMHPGVTAMMYRANQKWDQGADVRDRRVIGHVGDYQVDIPNPLNIIAPYWPISHSQAFLPNPNASNGVDEAANVTAALGIQPYNWIEGVGRMLSEGRTNVSSLNDFRPQESIPPIQAGFRAGMVALGNSKLRDAMVRNEPDYRLVATGRYLSDAVARGEMTLEDSVMAMEYGTSVYYNVDGVFGDYDPVKAAETFTDASQAYYGDILTNQLISHMFFPVGLRRENIEDMRQERLDNTGQYNPDGNTGATSENRSNFLGANEDIRAYGLANKMYGDPAAAPTMPEPYDENSNWFDQEWGYDPRSPGESYFRAMKYMERDAANEALFAESEAVVVEGRLEGLTDKEINSKLYDVRDKYFGEYGVEDSLGIMGEIDEKYSEIIPPSESGEYNPFPYLHPSEAALELLSQVLVAARNEYKDDKVYYPGDDAEWSEKKAYFAANDKYNESVSKYAYEAMNDFGRMVELAHGFPLDANELQRVVDVMVNAGTPAAKAIEPATMATVMGEAGLIYRAMNDTDGTTEDGKLYRKIVDGEIVLEEEPPENDLGWVPESSLKYGSAQPRSTAQALTTGELKVEKEDLAKLLLEIKNMDEPDVVKDVRRAILESESSSSGGGGGGGGGGGRRGGGGGGGGGYGGGWANNGLAQVRLAFYPSSGVSNYLMPDSRNRRGIRRPDSSYMWNLINGFKYTDQPKFKKLGR